MQFSVISNTSFGVGFLPFFQKDKNPCHIQDILFYMRGCKLEPAENKINQTV